jgi:hypothetical protein
MASRNSFRAGYGRRAIVRSCEDRAVEYDVFGKQLANLGECRFTGFPQFAQRMHCDFSHAVLFADAVSSN